MKVSRDRACQLTMQVEELCKRIEFLTPSPMSGPGFVGRN
jgi:hypothetical protein